MIVNLRKPEGSVTAETCIQLMATEIRAENVKGPYNWRHPWRDRKGWSTIGCVGTFLKVTHALLVFSTSNDKQVYRQLAQETILYCYMRESQDRPNADEHCYVGSYTRDLVCVSIGPTP